MALSFISRTQSPRTQFLSRSQLEQKELFSHRVKEFKDIFQSNILPPNLPVYNNAKTTNIFKVTKQEGINRIVIVLPINDNNAERSNLRLYTAYMH